MDEFLSDIYVSVFRRWIVLQGTDLGLVEDENKISLNTDSTESYITFNNNNIIELCVYNKVKDNTEFYLHFQMKNLKHAVNLFEEMKATIDKISTKPYINVMLCCSGGLTTSFFAQKINETVELLDLNIHVSAVGYQKLYQIKDDYDIVLLAPQISYELAQAKALLKDKIVKEIPAGVFATYDVHTILDIIEDSMKEYQNDENNHHKERISFQRNTEIKETVLCLSIYNNNQHNYINYRVYHHQHIKLEKEIVKNTISLNDIYSVIDICLLDFPKIKKIAISIPGIVNNGQVLSTFVENGNCHLKDILEKKYKIQAIISNDVNSAALGYYASQNQYDSFCFLFQPIGIDAGLGTVIDGKLITGNSSIAGEVKFLPLDLSQPKEELYITPKGILEVVYKLILTTICILSPTVIVLYCDLIDDPQIVEDKLKESLNGHVENYHINIIKIDNLQQYILLGLFNLCIEDSFD
ncbi:MAG: ROK family protein [Erysipelotrichaceae bacterium]|nr:ROK family protein [Erysipelotrichaceae bacterium]